MTVFKSRIFCYAKDGENPDQNQDAFQVDVSRGIAVVADGVSSAIFSAAWARILTQHVVADLPDPGDEAAFRDWIGGLRKEWEAGIETENLAWFQRPKLASGAFSTLLWTHVREIVPPKPGTQAWEKLRDPDPARRCFHVKGACIGDSCLFHVRPGSTNSGMLPGTDLFCALPLTDPAAFDLPPIVIGSKDLGRDAQMKFTPIELLVQEGDLLILATDAVSQWLLRCYEAQAYPRWDLFWELDQGSWETELDAMRANGEIRYDDSTLVLLQMGDSETFLNPVEPLDAAEMPSVPEMGSFGDEDDPEIELETEPMGVSMDELENAPEIELEIELEIEPMGVSMDELENAPEIELETEPADTSEYVPETVNAETFTPAANLESECEAEAFEPGSADEGEAVSVFKSGSAAVDPDPASGPGRRVSKTAGQNASSSVRNAENARIVRNAGNAGSPQSTGTARTQGGFQYRMASSKSPRCFEDGEGPASSAEASRQVSGSRIPAGNGTPAVSAFSEGRGAGAGVRTSAGNGSGGVRPAGVSGNASQSVSSRASASAESSDLTKGWQQIREGSAQIAGILGEQLSDSMSRLGSSMNRLGSQLNEGVDQFSDAAKPKIQSMASRFAGLFRRKDSEGEAQSTEDSESETHEPPKRVVDPNRRRFYNPPPRE